MRYLIILIIFIFGCVAIPPAPKPIEIKFVITECERINETMFACDYEVRYQGKCPGRGRFYFDLEGENGELSAYSPIKIQ